MKIASLLAGLALALPLVAGAQEVWRCGPDGKTYSNQPCPEGRKLDLGEARPAADVADARQRAAEERRTADALTKERLAREVAQRGNGLAAMAPRADELKPVSTKKVPPKTKPVRRAHHPKPPAA